MRSQKAQNLERTSPFSLSPGTAWRAATRFAARCFLAVVPFSLRHRLGWWTWEDVLGDRYRDLVLSSPVRPGGGGPAALLVKKGVPFPERSFQPNRHCTPFLAVSGDFAFDVSWWTSLSSSGSHCGKTELSPEFSAWVTTLSAFQEGRELLGDAFRRTILKGSFQASVALMEAGFNPLESPFLSRKLTEALWSSDLSFSDRLGFWRAMAEACPGFDRQAWEHQETAFPFDEPGAAVRLRIVRQDLETWRKTGLAMPSGMSAVRFAQAWFVFGPPTTVASKVRHSWVASTSERVSFSTEAKEAFRWWASSGLLPPEAPTLLFKLFIGNTLREGEFSPGAVEAAAVELLENGLPRRPAHGPLSLCGFFFGAHVDEEENSLPWLYWALAASSLNWLPPVAVDALLNEPGVLTARDKHGETALGLLSMVAKRVPLSEGSRSVLERLRAMKRRAALEEFVSPIAGTFEGSSLCDKKSISRRRL